MACGCAITIGKGGVRCRGREDGTGRRVTTRRMQTWAAMEISREIWAWADPNDRKSIRVVWCQGVWRGVPLPVRVKLWLILIGVPMSDRLPGCGCLDRLKRWAEWLDARGWWPVGWLGED